MFSLWCVVFFFNVLLGFFCLFIFVWFEFFSIVVICFFRFVILCCKILFLFEIFINLFFKSKFLFFIMERVVLRILFFIFNFVIFLFWFFSKCLMIVIFFFRDFILFVMIWDKYVIVNIRVSMVKVILYRLNLYIFNW